MHAPAESTTLPRGLKQDETHATVTKNSKGLPVTLTCWSHESHLSQIFTGLAMLDRQGSIALTQKFVPAPPPDRTARPHLVHVKNWHCVIEVAGRRLYIDTHDGDEIAANVECDVYLKRGKSPLTTDPKVRALGLNYEVYADGFDKFEFARRVRMRGLVSAAKYLIRHRASVSDLEGTPLDGNTEPKALFMCRTWEPNHADPAKNEERVAINRMRTDIILGLRKNFGSRCIAGFSPSPHALRDHREAVLEVDMSDPASYIKVMRKTPICITSMGLHGSNGWKLGEYVANFRAIVSETLRQEAPGFVAGEHYLPFQSADECMEAVGRLMQSPSACQNMSAVNRSYYHNTLRPDRLMARAIEIGAPGALPGVKQ